MPRYVIGVGSNSKDAEARVESALRFLGCELDNVRSSNVYRTPSTKNDGTFYVNAVVSGFSSHPVEILERICKDYEQAQGRVKAPEAPVVIDLDVVIKDEKVLRPRDLSQSYFTIGFNKIFH